MASKGGGKGQIIGYRYKMAFQMGIGRGPINELIEIRVGNLSAWTGSITTSSFADINMPLLFGGDEKEGGIKGTFKLFMGEPTQTIDSIITNRLQAPVPGWRGVTTLFWYGQVGSNNPYPKPWKARVRRTTAGWDNDDPFYPAAAAITLSPDPVVTATFHYNPSNNQTIVINGHTLTFRTVAGAAINVTIDADPVTTVAHFVTAVNNNSATLGNVVANSDGGNIVELRSSSGLPTVTSNYGFVTFVTAGGDIVGMNPAHIIYECATNNVWGRGLPASFIDADSFTVAANKLYDEGFGICIRWNRQDDIDKFVQTIVNHIGAAVYIDRETGLLTLKLIRNDYVAADLTTYSFENGLLDIIEDESSSSDTTYNEIIVKYRDPITDQVGSVRVQNLASFQSLKTLISTTVDYLGCATSSLALRLAQRDLEIASNNLRRMTLKLDRVAYAITPGSVFRINVPTRGIENMVLRAGNIEDSPLTDGTITVSAVQDVFSLPETSFIATQPTIWNPPDRSARIIDVRDLREATYFDLSENLPTFSLDAITSDTGFIKIFAKQPNDAATGYMIHDAADGEPLVDRNVCGFDDGAKLGGSIGLYTTALTFTDGFGLDQVAVGMPLYIGDEYMRIDAFDATLLTATVARGCIDTLPAVHTIGDRIWFQTAAPSTDFRDYATSEVIHVQLLTQTTTDQLSAGIAPTDDITIAGRQGRPYPPGNLKVDGTRYGDVPIADGDIVLTWAHRDRIVEGNQLVEHQAGSTGPEPGTTYTIRVYDGDTGLSLLRTVTAIAGTTWTYDLAMMTADGSLFSWWFELEAVRAGLVSWQKYRFKITRPPGFDEGFDDNFDGGV